MKLVAEQNFFLDKSKMISYNAHKMKKEIKN
jgi:hypothetical protein